MTTYETSLRPIREIMAAADAPEPAINLDRVHRLIEILERVQEKNAPFNMVSWFEDDESPHDCGTAACAMGHACRDPQFQEQGLTIGQEHQGYLGAHPSFAGYAALEACEKFFGFSYGEADYIFYDQDSGKHETPADVIERISRVLLDRVT